MKWFKHESNAHANPKLEKVLMRYGADGYALYWMCLEAIAAPIDKHNLTFELKHDAEILGYRLKIDSARAEEIMMFMVNQKLFELDQTTKTITCLKLAERLENSTIKNPQLKEIQKQLSGKITDNPGQSRLDKTRLDKNIDNNPLVEEDDSSDFKEEKKHTEDDEKMANFMFARILDVAPKQKKPDIGKWADTIRLMRERDNLTHKEIQDVFIWANTDSFWKANILSPAKLRDKFSALDAKMRSGNGTHKQSGKHSVAERQTELRKLAEARAAELEANS